MCSDVNNHVNMTEQSQLIICMEMADCIPFSIYILVSRWRSYSYSNYIVALSSGNKTVMRGGGALDVDRRGV